MKRQKSKLPDGVTKCPVVMILKLDDLGEVHALPRHLRKRWCSQSEATDCSDGRTCGNFRRVCRSFSDALTYSDAKQELEARMCAAQQKRVAYLDKLREKALASRPQGGKVLAVPLDMQLSSTPYSFAQDFDPSGDIRDDVIVRQRPPTRPRSSSRFSSPKSVKLRSSSRVTIRITARSTSASFSLVQGDGIQRDQRVNGRTKRTPLARAIYKSLMKRHSQSTATPSCPPVEKTNLDKSLTPSTSSRPTPSTSSSASAPTTPPRKADGALSRWLPHRQEPSLTCSTGRAPVRSPRQTSPVSQGVPNLSESPSNRTTTSRPASLSQATISQYPSSAAALGIFQRPELGRDLGAVASNSREDDGPPESLPTQAVGVGVGLPTGNARSLLSQEPPSPTALSTMFPHRAKYMAFDRLAETVLKVETLATTKALLQVFERALQRGSKVSDYTAVDELLRRLFPKAPPAAKMERYPSRVFLSAYMITAHPEVVFNHRGAVQQGLQAAAEELLGSFEEAVRQLPGNGTDFASWCADHVLFDGDVLLRFDECWCTYLQLFVAWKLEDAAAIQSHLVGMAVELETSLLQKVGPHSLDSMRVQQSPDLQAMIAQVRHDHGLIRDRVMKLTGGCGVKQMEDALEAARKLVKRQQQQQLMCVQEQ